MENVVCIMCPRGCRLAVNADSNEVSGAACARGTTYGLNEVTNPVRTLTSTVRISGAAHRRLPVRTDGQLPKKLVMQAVRLLDEVDVKAPVSMGDKILENILGTSVSFVAERDMA